MSEWKKVKIGDFLTEREGRYKPDDSKISKYKRLDKIDFSGNIHISDKPTKTDMIIVHPGDLIISGINVAKGAIAVYQGDEPVYATIHYSSYTFDSSKVDLDYFKYFVKSPAFIAALQKQVKGGIKTEIKPKRLLPLEISIPDLQTQQEIVKKISSQLQKTEQLSVEIESQKNYIKQLRKNILQDAIEGNLTADWRKQNPVKKGNPDYDAEALFEQIQKEKYHTVSILLMQNHDKKKKGKSLDFPNPCDNEEKPFAIPDGWKWVRLGEIIDSIVYGTSEKCSYDDRQNSAILRIPNISSGIIDATDLKYTNLSKTEKNELSLRENDVLVIRSNGSPEIVGKMVNVPKDYENYCYAGYLIRLRFTIPEIGLFIAKISSTNNLRKQIEEPLRTTVGINNINSDEIKALRFPLPPLEEQKEIVTRIAKHLQSVSDLENQITKREQLTKQLMQSILKDAFEEN